MAPVSLPLPVLFVAWFNEGFDGESFIVGALVCRVPVFEIGGLKRRWDWRTQQAWKFVSKLPPYDPEPLFGNCGNLDTNCDPNNRLRFPCGRV